MKYSTNFGPCPASVGVTHPPELLFMLECLYACRTRRGRDGCWLFAVVHSTIIHCQKLTTHFFFLQYVESHTQNSIVEEATLKAWLCKLPITPHWKKLNYSKATVGGKKKKKKSTFTTKFLFCSPLKCSITFAESRLFLLMSVRGTKLDESPQQTRGLWLWRGRWWWFGGGCNPLSLYKHNNNTSNTLLAALLMYFQAKTGIFASCVIYCGSHLHIKALIIPSEHVCVYVCVCVCVWGGFGRV